MSNLIVNLDVYPSEPGTLKVSEHAPGGQFPWDLDKVELYLSEDQKGNGCISGHNLRKELKDKRVANACLLDFLLAHPELIPSSWKGNVIYFWGTIYSNGRGGPGVRTLYWSKGSNGARWSEGAVGTWFGLDSSSPALILAP